MPRKPQNRIPPAATPDFVARVKKMVEAQGSLRQVGTACGLSPEQVGRWVSGRAEPRFTGLAALARLSGHSLNWLAYGEGPEHADADTDAAPDSEPTLPPHPALPGLEERVRAALGPDTPSEFADRHGVAVETVEAALYGDLGSLVSLAEAVGWSLDHLVLDRSGSALAAPPKAGPAPPTAATTATGATAAGATAAGATATTPETHVEPDLAGLVRQAVRAVEQQVTAATLVLDAEDRADMTAIYFRALLRKARTEADAGPAATAAAAERPEEPARDAAPPDAPEPRSKTAAKGATGKRPAPARRTPPTRRRPRS